MSPELARFQKYREILYQSLPFRRSAVLNLLDALCVDGKKARSVVELSTSKYFPRKYSSVSDAIGDGLAACSHSSFLRHGFEKKKSTLGYYRFAIDTTSVKRTHADTLSDRSIVHHPQHTPGNKPIAVGHSYSVLTQLPEGSSQQRKGWSIPLGCARVHSQEKGPEKGMQQMNELVEKLGLEDHKVLSIGDSSYSSKACLSKISSSGQVHLFRTRITRNAWELLPEPPQGERKRGGQTRYGRKMNLNEPSTHFAPTNEICFIRKTRRGKEIRVECSFWDDVVFRGSQNNKGYSHPFRLMCFRLYDSSQNPIHKRPLWIGAMGDWRKELSVQECFDHYTDRFDIEHLFRFGKQNLLLDQYQSPETEHEEAWWSLAMLAYQQLYSVREQVDKIPQEWEKYLPEFKDSESKLASPAQTQRAFAKILDLVGTPALSPTPRGKPKGRSKDEKQRKRLLQEIVWKMSQSQRKKKGKGSARTRGNKGKNSEPKMNQSQFLEYFKSEIRAHHFSISEIGKALLG